MSALPLGAAFVGQKTYPAATSSPLATLSAIADLIVLATRWWDERGWPVVRKAFFASVPALVRGVVASMVRKGTVKRLRGRDFVRAGSKAYQERLDAVLDLLEARAPEQGFWLGPEPTVADLRLFAHPHQLRMPLTSFRADEVKRRARLSAWLDRVDLATR